MNVFSRFLFKSTPRAAKAAPDGTVSFEFDSDSGASGNLLLTHPDGTVRPFSGNVRAGTPVGSVKAVKTLTNSGTNISAAAVLTSDNTNVADGATVTIGSKVYTFKTALTPAEGQVLIGADADGSLLNLIRAINHTGTPDTDYKCAAAHPYVYADAAVASHTILVRATARTAATDALALDESSSHLSWNRSTLQARVTVGEKVYTFCVFKASNTLTSDGTNPSNDDKVVIGSKTYTFQTTLTNTDGNVKIGANSTATMTNLFRAINASGGTPGTDYASNMAANTQVTATNPSATTVVVTAIANGQASNAIATTETSTHLSWAATTLGGAGATAISTGGTLDGDVCIGSANTDSMTNLYAAINASGTDGLQHEVSARGAHPDVVATNPSGTTVTITARTGGAAGTNITTTETSTVLSWANITAGVDGTVASKGESLFDGTYYYFANADLTTASLTGWRKIAHSAL